MIPKPKPYRLVKAARRRNERAVIEGVRAKCVDRDGYCRLALAKHLLGPCDGPSEWMHLGENRRFRTVGQEPERRHTTSGTMMGCHRHHYAYDKTHLYVVVPLTEAGADGTLRIEIPKDKDVNTYGVRSCLV